MVSRKSCWTRRARALIFTPPMIARFAPSPTGFLHLGHAYSALRAWEAACHADEKFLLRLEDIDHQRVREKYERAIVDDLRWLGLRWPEPLMRQSERRPAYDEALQNLKSLGVLYPCFCTRREIEEELATLAKAPHGPEGAHYPGTCRRLGAAEIARLQRERDAAWRLDAGKAAALVGELTFRDQIHGLTNVDPALLGDPILARRDIGTSYHLAVVVDDAAQEISLVTRGEDLLHATHLHRVLQSLLAFPEPEYHHHQLIRDENGKRLAKRHDALSLQSLRAQGKTRAEILKLLPETRFQTKEK